MKPGQPERIDYERGGTANLFMLFAPLEGFRHIEVTDHRKTIDYAKILKDLSDIHFPRAKKIALVQDNLNTHARALQFYRSQGFELSAFVLNNPGHFPMLLEIDCIMYRSALLKPSP